VTAVLSSQETAVDGDDGAGGITRRRHAQKHHCTRDIIRLPPALEGGARGDAVYPG
jgi:hypothetical protein